MLDHFENDMVVINDDANSDSYEFMGVQVQTDDSSCLTTVENPTLITTTNHQVVKLQLNATSSSHTLLACMFQIADKRTVSRIINSARQAIVKSFVPDNLGFGHVTREDVIGRHTTTIARELMCGGDSTDIAIIIIDGTYLYNQTSRNNEFRRTTFKLYKKRSLLKPMMIVTTTGYIVACIGPFMSDFNNSDAAIMKDILLRNTDHILSRLKEHDILVVDRGLRDSIGVMKALVSEATMPSFLGGRSVFQLKRARSYAEERCSTTNLTSDVVYSVHRCKIIPNFIRSPTQSAHSNRVTYHPTIHFTDQAILAWWCDCFTGTRFLSCCSHIAAAIRFLSYQRWQTQQRHIPPGEYKNIATDSIQVSDFYDSSDDDDSQRYTLT
ncbi:unnamed protein product, partial [Rotaria magnacalcarata]